VVNADKSSATISSFKVFLEDSERVPFVACWDVTWALLFEAFLIDL